MYNDALIPALAEHHPAALGSPGEQIYKEAWPIVGRQLAREREQKIAEKYERNAIPVEGKGVVEGTFWDYNYTLVFGLEYGTVGGLLNNAQKLTRALLDWRTSRTSPGVGIARELLANIYRSFYTTKGANVSDF